MGTVFQVSTISALAMGYTKSVISVEELLSHGDIGLGTFEHVNGEMIVVDGICYQAQDDGSAYPIDGGMGVPFAVIIGILTGIGNLIPYVGPIVAYGSTILVCLVHFDIQKLIIAVIVICIIQTIDGNVINPRLLSHSISVHPMLVIASLIVGGAAGGIVGMLLAVPVAGLMKLYFDRFIQDVLNRRNQEPVDLTEVFDQEEEGELNPETPEQEEEE